MKSPLGPYGSLAATIISISIVLACVATHIFTFLEPSAFLDTMATAVIGIVLGVQVATNGSTSTATSALIAANAAHQRLDEIKAPAAAITPTPAGE